MTGSLKSLIGAYLLVPSRHFPDIHSRPTRLFATLKEKIALTQAAGKADPFLHCMPSCSYLVQKNQWEAIVATRPLLTTLT